MMFYKKLIDILTVLLIIIMCVHIVIIKLFYDTVFMTVMIDSLGKWFILYFIGFLILLINNIIIDIIYSKN